MKIAVLLADGFQDSEYFLPKVEIEKLGVQIEVVSLRSQPVEIWSYFSRIGSLDVNRTINQATVHDYDGVLVPGGARSPALLAESGEVLDFVRAMNRADKMVASICRGSLLVAASGICSGRRMTGFHLEEQYPDLAVRPAIETAGGIWVSAEPVVVDGNMISSRHPDDVPHFSKAISRWLSPDREKGNERNES